MKAYLLGALGERESAVLEEKYFSDPAVLSWVRDTEDELIRDYLGERLPPLERERFERRYLVVPELLKRVEAVRSQAPRPVAYQWRVQIVVTSLVLALCVFAVWRFGREKAPVPPMVARDAPRVVPAVLLTIRLTPGVRKSGDAAMTEFAPPANGRVRLTLELPGVASPLACKAVLTLVPNREVWSSGVLQSSPAQGGQEVAAEVDSAALPPGDYIARVDSLAAGTLQTYEFRVNPGQ